MKKNRRNGLKSFLFVCLGLTVVTITAAGVSTVVTAPTSPGIPLAVDIWETGCLLNYRAPKNDGGEPVTNYYIEHRGNWELPWKYRGASRIPEYQFKGMKEGSRAQFRVSASNKAGISKPSASSDFIRLRSH